MKRFFGFLLFFGLCTVSCSAQIDVPHKTEKVKFQKDQFHVVGEVMLGAGYATLMWDKPGFGKSKGEFSSDHLREERAEVLVAAIDHMKSHPRK